jgi:hypothetical protein
MLFLLRHISTKADIYALTSGYLPCPLYTLSAYDRQVFVRPRKKASEEMQTCQSLQARQLPFLAG